MGLKDAEKQVDRAFTRDSYTGQSFENAFGGATSFLRLKYTKELNNVDLAITESHLIKQLPIGQGRVLVHAQ